MAATPDPSSVAAKVRVRGAALQPAGRPVTVVTGLERSAACPDVDSANVVPPKTPHL